jgi:hypothetical protein
MSTLGSSNRNVALTCPNASFPVAELDFQLHETGSQLRPFISGAVTPNLAWTRGDGKHARDPPTATLVRSYCAARRNEATAAIPKSRPVDTATAQLAAGLGRFYWYACSHHWMRSAAKRVKAQFHQELSSLFVRYRTRCRRLMISHLHRRKQSQSRVISCPRTCEQEHRLRLHREMIIEERARVTVASVSFADALPEED